MHLEASFFDDSLARTGEILTQSFFPDSLRAAPTFAFFHGKQQSMNSSCDHSYFAGNWQKSSKSNEYKLNSCKRGISVGEGSNTSSGILEISRSCFDSSTINNMRNGSSSIKDNFVYKRRKMQKNAVALLSDENTDEITVENILSDCNLSSLDCQLSPNEDSSFEALAAADHSSDDQDNGKPSFSGRHHLDVHIISNSNIIDQNNLESAKDVRNNEQISHSAEVLTNKLCSSNLTVFREQSGDGHTSDALSLDCLEKFETLEEMCIYVLKRHGLIRGRSRNDACPPSENTGSAGPLLISCKICGLPESALKMLICDDCEEAFHLPCCRPKIKRLPSDEWYCQFCFTKKRKHLLRKSMGKSSAEVDYISESGGPIVSMMNDYRPHRSRVRVGEDFQAKVPDWSDSISNGDNYFGDPKEMDHADCRVVGDFSRFKSSNSNSIGNWLQCKEEDDNGNICGKWRRAPLFSVQTNEWDCSCALPWDPIHADCAVPQELDTEMIYKHLKYSEVFRTRVNNRTKPV